MTNPEQLRRIADVAENYQVPVVKLTGGQRIDLLGVRKEDLPNVWRDLGMTCGSADPSGGLPRGTVPEWRAG